jgi:SAM-dependent methyltransferase
MTSGLVGEMPPEPPTLRGRVGSWLIRRIRRALFWYTPRIVEFQQNVSRAMEQEVEAIQEIARENEALRLRIAEMETNRVAIESLRKDLTKEITARRAVEAWAGSEVTSLHAALEGQIRAVIDHQETDRNQWHGLLEQEGAAREALEGQIRAVIHQQEADRNQWYGLLEQEAAARESVGSQIAGLRETQHQIRGRLSSLTEDAFRSIDAVASQAAEPRSALEGQIRAVIHQQEADRNQWHGLLEQEAAARGAVAADMTVGVNRSDTLERRLSDDERIIFTTRNAVFSQEMRISVLLEQARKRLGKMNAAELAGIVREEERRFDSMYLTFEDHFRGRREDVKDRLRVYLPFLEAHNIGRTGMPILDVGCGRGEWLELLRDHGLDARGVDANRLMVAQCLEQKLPATEGDAVAFLRGLAPDSLGGVSGFHIIEHLPFAYLIDLIDEAVRVLKPGGIVIFETPNPANVLVATEYFYFDPTHRNPLPSLLMRFVAEQRGLCRVEVLELNPWPEAFHLREPGSVVAERFNQLFYGPQEYAIIGWKA